MVVVRSAVHRLSAEGRKVQMKGQRKMDMKLMRCWLHGLLEKSTWWSEPRLLCVCVCVFVIMAGAVARHCLDKERTDEVGEREKERDGKDVLPVLSWMDRMK